MPRRNSSRILLNDYGNSAASYSFRRLSSRYSGFAARIRRSTDNVEIDVPFNSDAGLGTANVEQFLQSCTGGFGTNLLLQSENLATTWVIDSATLTANQSSSPVGTQTMDRLTSNGGVYPGASQNIPIVAGTTYNLSLYYRVVNQALAADQQTPEGGLLLRGLLAAPDFGGIGPSVSYISSSNLDVEVSPGVYRRSVSFTANQTGNRRVGFFFIDNTANGATASGRVYDFWGMQVTVGAGVTAYDYKGADTTAASAFVTTWYDQSGNGRNATQATAANQPRVVNIGVADKVNGRVSVRFDSGKYFVSTQSVFSLGAGVYSVFLTAESTNTSQCVFFSGGNAATNRAVGGALQLGVERHFWFSNDLDSVVSASTDFVQRSYFYTGVSRSTYRNSVLIAQDNPTGKNTGSGVLYIGALASNLNFNVIGQYPELVIYNIDQSASRTTIESNITQTYFGAPRLLNRFPNAAVAYSTRKLDRFYSGSALRVRRSNDNAELDIGFDANGNLNESALLAFVGTNSAFVTTWYDQSGNARNATQATAANQPRIVNAGVVDKVNGKVAVFYTGSPSTHSFSFTGFTPSSGTSFNTYMLSNADVRGLIIHGGSLSPDYFDVWDQDTSISPAENAISVTQNYINGVLVSPLTRAQRYSRLVPTPALRVDTFLGVTGGALSKINGYEGFTVDNGYHSEFVFYNSNQSANRTLIEQDIISYFGVV